MGKNISSSNLRFESGSNPIVFERVFKFFGDKNETPALDDVSFSVKAGEFVCFVGPSGSGKTTVLKIIAGLEKESSGKVIRPQSVGMVFQSGALFPWLTVFDNVALVLRIKGIAEERVKRESLHYITMAGLRDFTDKYPRELSGGQRQRVGIARAFAVDPTVLLLDEPFSALDIRTTIDLNRDLLKIWRETKKTIVMVSHSVEEAIALADRVILMKDFRIIKIFEISLSRPRREDKSGFNQEVTRIQEEFFR